MPQTPEARERDDQPRAVPIVELLERARRPAAGHVYVLSEARGSDPAGSRVVKPAGSAPAAESPEGCIVLLVWERPITFLEAC